MRLLARSGGSLTKGPVLFSRDGEHLFACREQGIVVLDGKTAAYIKTLGGSGKTAVGHRRPVVALALHPSQDGQILSADKDGVVVCWQVDTGLPVGSVAIRGKTVAGLLSPRLAREGDDDDSSSILVVCRTSDATEEKRQAGLVEICRLNVNRMGAADCLTRVSAYKAGSKGRGRVLVALSDDGRWLASIKGLEASLCDLEAGATFKAVLPCRAYRIALHPHEPVLYWAAKDGRMTATHMEGGADATYMHWHPRLPNTIAATPDGRHLLSGGEEGVVVLWDLERAQRTFLPHLNSAVLSVASNGAGDRYAVQLACNSILLVGAGSMRIIGRFDGIKGGPAPSRVGLVRDPRDASSVLLSGTPGALQSYDAVRGCATGRDIDVCQQNIVGRGPREGALIWSECCVVAFSADGKWMATYDRRMAGERRLHHDQLKFWRHRNGEFSLYTAFDVPHDEPICAIAFSPVREGPIYRCVTVGEDAQCKTWSSAGRRVVFMDASAKTVEQTTWIQDGAVAHKGLGCRAAAYSDDGSLLAIGFGRVVRLYDAGSLRLVGSLLPHQTNGDMIRELLVIGDYVVAADGGALFVWDLNTMSAVWSLHTPVFGVKRHPNIESFVAIAAAGKHHFVMVFTAHSPVPVTCYRQSSAVVDVVPVRAERKGPVLLALMDRTGHIGVVGGVGGVVGDRTGRGKIPGEQLARQLAEAEAEVETRTKNTIDPVPVRRPRLPYVKKETLLLSDVPTHLLPNMMDAFACFIKFKLPLA